MTRWNVERLGFLCITFLLISSLAFSSGITQSFQDAEVGLKSIQADEIRAHVKFLSADELEGRNTPSQGLKLASIYIVSQYERDGVSPGGPYGEFYQPFKLRSLDKILNTTAAELEDTLGAASFVRTYKLKTDFIPFSYTANMKVTSEVVWAGYGITAPELGFDEYESIDARGKIVLMMSHVPREKDDYSAFVRNGNDYRLGGLLSKLENASAHGAVGVLLVTDPNNYDPTAAKSRDRHVLDVRGSRWPNLNSRNRGREILILPQDVQPLVTAHISNAMAADILSGTGKTLDQYQTEIDNSLQPVSREIEHKIFSIQTSYEYSEKNTRNVAGFIEGSDPLLKDELVVYCAHYDHVGVRGDDIYNGADDNASGSAALLEIAEAYAVNPLKPRRSILFLHVSGEEKGLLGSKFYVSHPEYLLDKTIACINLDMISRNDPDSIGVIGGDLISSDLGRIIEKANTKIGMHLGYEFNKMSDPNRYFYRSDQYYFIRNGIPAVFYFSGPHPDYHKATDTVEKIDSQKAARVAKLAFLTGWDIANRRERLSVDGVLARYFKKKSE